MYCINLLLPLTLLGVYFHRTWGGGSVLPQAAGKTSLDYKSPTLPCSSQTIFRMLPDPHVLTTISNKTMVLPASILTSLDHKTAHVSWTQRLLVLPPFFPRSCVSLPLPGFQGCPQELASIFPTPSQLLGSLLEWGGAFSSLRLGLSHLPSQRSRFHRDHTAILQRGRQTPSITQIQNIPGQVDARKELWSFWKVPCSEGGILTQNKMPRK